MKDKIASLLEDTLGAKTPVDLSVPDHAAHGHYTTSIALRLAKERNESPIVIAEALKHDLLRKAPKNFFERIEVVPPGFVNMWVSQKVLVKELQRMLTAGSKYGRSNVGKRQKVQVEFISANPTGPLTVANGRGGFLGDVLSNVLAASGYKVEREYYVNDSGNQVKMLGFSVLTAAKLLPPTATPMGADGEPLPLYAGDHITSWTKTNKDKLKNYIEKPEALGMLVAKDFLAKLIKPAVTDLMKIKFDRWTSEERDIRKKGWPEKALQFFADRGLFYREDGAIWLRTTNFGDDKDRVLVKSDGSSTYFLNDAGHYLETAKRGFAGKINILGADHHGYVQRIQAVAQMVNLSWAETPIVQLFRIIKNGQEFRMSKRKGNFITMEELVREAGVDATRYFFLVVTPNKTMDFDIDLAKERSLKNPVFYVQYAYVRAQSILKKAKAPRTSKLSAKQAALLGSAEDIELMRLLARYPDVLADSARDRQVTRLPQYARELAERFHAFYEHERVAGEPHDTMLARVALVRASIVVLENLFGVLGISAPKKM